MRTSPEMTIEEIGARYGKPSRYAWCQWFDNLRLRQGVFAVHALELREPKAEEAGGWI